METPYLRQLRAVYLQQLRDYLRRETTLRADLLDPDEEEPPVYRNLKVHLNGEPRLYTVVTCIPHDTRWLYSVRDSTTDSSANLGLVADKEAVAARLAALLTLLPLALVDRLDLSRPNRVED